MGGLVSVSTAPHGPRTLAEVFAVASAEMDAPDPQAEQQRQVAAFLAGKPTGLRRPAKSLRKMLGGGLPWPGR
jgi:hypothetical protein